MTYCPELGVRRVREADPLEHAAEIDFAHQHIVLFIGFNHFAGYPEAHGRLRYEGHAESGADCSLLFRIFVDQLFEH